jgi:hypothetical protein
MKIKFIRYETFQIQINALIKVKSGIMSKDMQQK